MWRFLAGLLAGAGVAATLIWFRPSPPTPPPQPVFLDSVKETLKLAALEVQMHEVVRYEPLPPRYEGLALALRDWLKEFFAKEEGSAVVFATARYMVRLDTLSPAAVHTEGRRAQVELPEIEVALELRPEDTVLLRSTLRPGGETALLARAKQDLLNKAQSNVELRQRALRSAERSLRELLGRLGYAEITVGPVNGS